MAPSSRALTDLLQLWRSGSRDAESELFARLYCDLRRLARDCLRNERRNHTLQRTALVHEAYFRLVSQREKTWQDENHFVAVAKAAMHQILAEHGRNRKAKKRDGRLLRVGLEEVQPAQWIEWEPLLDLERALRDFSKEYQREAKAVQLFFFEGLKQQEIAAQLEVSVATVEKDLRFARVWLFRHLQKRPSR
jgi:RNA polymerase sigma factor (TIGR02999 family)